MSAAGSVFLHLERLTWTFLDTERSIGVFGSGVVLQLKGCGVVHKRLRALGHAGTAVVEIGASLQRSTQPGSDLEIIQVASNRRRCDFLTLVTAKERVLRQHFIFTSDCDIWITQLSLISLSAKWEKNWSH